MKFGTGERAQIFFPGAPGPMFQLLFELVFEIIDFLFDLYFSCFLKLHGKAAPQVTTHGAHASHPGALGRTKTDKLNN